MADPRQKKHRPGDASVCRRCSASYVITESMVRWGRYVCNPCQGRQFDNWRFRNLERARATNRRNSKKKSGKVKAKTAAYRRANPEKRAAHQAVQTALRNGSLVREPCGCGEKKTHAHHDDYGKPLDVRWLCHRCHMKAHGRFILAELDKPQE